MSWKFYYKFLFLLLRKCIKKVMNKPFVSYSLTSQNKLQEYRRIDTAVGWITWGFNVVNIRGRQDTMPSHFCPPPYSHLEFIPCNAGNTDVTFSTTRKICPDIYTVKEIHDYYTFFCSIQLQTLNIFPTNLLIFFSWRSLKASCLGCGWRRMAVRLNQLLAW
jgi:hypothetical protein